MDFIGRYPCMFNSYDPIAAGAARWFNDDYAILGYHLPEAAIT